MFINYIIESSLITAEIIVIRSPENFHEFQQFWQLLRFSTRGVFLTRGEAQRLKQRCSVVLVGTTKQPSVSRTILFFKSPVEYSVALKGDHSSDLSRVDPVSSETKEPISLGGRRLATATLASSPAGLNEKASIISVGPYFQIQYEHHQGIQHIHR